MGAEDVQQHGVWRWTNGLLADPILSGKWKPGQPSGQADQNWLATDTEFLKIWDHDLKPNAYVCEIDID